MFKNLQLWANIMLGMGLAIALAVGGLTWGSLHNTRSLIGDCERTGLAQTAATLLATVAAETRTAEALSALVASIPEVQSHFAAGDRAWLQAALLPAYAALAKDYGVVQFQFLTPPAKSFLRLHLIEKFGDDLSAIRKTVVDTNAQQRPQRGLEIGVAGLGARGMVPIYEAGRHLGTVEFGMSFGKPFFDAFKSTYGAEAGLHTIRDGRIATFASTFGDRRLLDEATLRAALSGTPQLGEALVDGQPMTVYATVVKDYSGKPLGVLELAGSRARYAAALAQATQQAWLVGGLAMLLCLAVALLTSRALGQRIRVMSEGVNRVAAGDLTQDIPADGKDELAALARAANGMRQHLHELVAEVDRNAAAVHRAARDIARAVDGQAANSSQMSASVAEITSTMEELSASSTQIAEYSESVVEVARRTFDESRNGAESMQRLAARMEEIHGDNRRALEEIVDLGSKSKEISKIMEIIDTVADRTKLIAFNAALEAASAGETGKRFGVVAAEIRRLADSVTESTGEIERKVGEIQESIGRLVVTSEKGTAGIEQGMQESAQTAGLLTALVEGAGETTDAAQQISLSSQQQKTASNQVVVALREIVAASADTAASVRRIAAIASDMTGLSARLQERVERFALEAPGSPAANGPESSPAASGPAQGPGSGQGPIGEARASPDAWQL